MLGLCALTIIVARYVSPALYLRGIVPEEMLVEELQVFVWVVTALACCYASLQQQHWRPVLLAAWLGVGSLAAGIREIDLHAVLNPPNIHILGLDSNAAVRWRLDWWMGEARDGSRVPAIVRLRWAIVILGFGTIAFTPFVLARYPWIRKLKEGEPFVWLLGIGAGLFGAGFLADDVIGRPLGRLGINVNPIEEGLELVAQFCVLAAVILLALRRAGQARQSPERSSLSSSAEV